MLRPTFGVCKCGYLWRRVRRGMSQVHFAHSPPGVSLRKGLSRPGIREFTARVFLIDLAIRSNLPINWRNYRVVTCRQENTHLVCRSLAGLARRLALRACAVAPEREHCSGTAATSSTHCPPLSPHSPLHPPPPARTPVTASRAASPGDQPSASSTSAVAIDNKIEQAMDLVKSHLMFAVREEVEVLKERIAELMERINQLELENTILKQHASQETLAQLGSSKGTVAATQGPQQPTPQGQASLSLGQQAQPPASQVAPTSANNPTPMV